MSEPSDTWVSVSKEIVAVGQTYEEMVEDLIEGIVAALAANKTEAERLRDEAERQM